jgi:hypothetical protein
MHARGWTVFLLSTWLLASCSGCRPATDRVPLHGEVTFQGRPLEHGHITFLTTSGLPGPVCGAVIRDGRFDIPGEQGLSPGTYRVLISSPGGVAPQTPEEIAAGASPRAMEQLPPEYNTESKLTAEVTAEGPNRFEFHLQ